MTAKRSKIFKEEEVRSHRQETTVRKYSSSIECKLLCNVIYSPNTEIESQQLRSIVTSMARN